MNLEAKNIWLRALRSGAYLQTKGTLQGERDDGKTGYCCLGVLMSACGTSPMDWARDRNEDDPEAELPTSALDPAHAEGLTVTQMTMLANLNDSGCLSNDAKKQMQDWGYDLNNLHETAWSFDQIADLIEKHL